MPGQQQVVPQAILNQKLGRKLALGDEFETTVGVWKVVGLCQDGNDTYTIRRVDYGR